MSSSSISMADEKSMREEMRDLSKQICHVNAILEKHIETNRLIIDRQQEMLGMMHTDIYGEAFDKPGCKQHVVELLGDKKRRSTYEKMIAVPVVGLLVDRVWHFLKIT